MRPLGDLVRRPSVWAFVALVLLAAQPSAGTSPRPDQDAPLSIRITSPLGRTGAAGAVRIVAQVHATPGTALNPVRIFVDNVLLGEVADGPPWALEWTDENPFAPREIAAEVTDALGRSARDVVVLKPFEVVEKAEVSSVLLEASVQDRFGRFVTGIPPSGFTVFEDNVPQSLDLVRSETLPATFTLLIDRSQSMGRRIEFVRDAAAALAGYLRPQDRIIVAPFSKTIGAVTGPTDDRQTVTDAIRGIRSSGGTAILDCVEGATRLIGGLEGRHAIVLITDGYDEHSSSRFEDVLASVQKSGASVYVVGIGGVAGISIRGERLLKRLATETGGKAFFPAREIELRPVHEQVASDVQLRYLLSYTPRNQTVDGTWRQVQVRASDPTWVVRTRPGYFAPKPPPVRPAIEFTMIDTNRQPLNVSADTLRVLEDGIEQSVDVFQEAVTPVSIVFALDTSGSMRKVAEEVKAAARSFVEALRPQDPLGLVLFSDRAVFAHDLSTTRTWSLDAIDKYQAIGGTALYDAVYNSLTRLRGMEGRRVVVVMTDGRDENNQGDGPGSVHRLEDVFERLKSVEATVFAIGLGTRIDRALLERLAAESGGEAAFPLDVTTLPQEFRRIVENLRKRYVISYTSTNSTRDGKWRTVQILSTTSGVTSVSRGGYFAPPQ
jgi:Ca-activated chloride channel family protein